jgi:anti-sigma regulatory factor (Ser/Thr protein kinase)
MREDPGPKDAGVTSASVTSYAGDPGSIAAARRQAVDFLAGLRDRSGPPPSPQNTVDLQLIVSELVTNAVKFAPGPCTVSLRPTGRQVEISVTDSSSLSPAPHSAEPGRVEQHGLEIVLALCGSLEVRREAVGKRIVACLELGDESAPGR